MFTDGFFSTGDSCKDSVQQAVDEFLNKEMSKYKLFFYDLQCLSFRPNCAVFEGKIFSPSRASNEATGFYFLKRQTPPTNSSGEQQAYYLLYYTYELNYETAKAEFEKISSYVHYVEEGCVTSAYQ